MPPRAVPSQSRGGARGTVPRGGAAPRGAGAARGAARGGARGGGPALAGSGAGVAGGALPGAQITTIGVRRPGYGSNGRPIGVFTNNFVVSSPESLIIHYDGECTVHLHKTRD